MKIEVIVIFVILAIGVLFSAFRNEPSSSILSVNRVSVPKAEIPATWNLDWQGGPGADRFLILNEKGPYNM